MPCSQNLVVLAGMPLVRADVADSAVQMLDVVPVYELAGPASGLIQIFESTSDILRSVLGGSEGRFRKGVVVAYSWSGVRGFDSEPVEHCQNGRRFKRGAVIAVQDGFGLIGSDSLGKSGSLNDSGGMVGIVRFMNLPAHDLAAVDVENQIQIKPASCDVGGQVRHIPAPELTPEFDSLKCKRLIPMGFGLKRSTTD